MNENKQRPAVENTHQAKRGFVRYSKTKSAADYEYVEIGFGLYDLENGGTWGEMGVVWKDLLRNNKLVPCLHAWHDSWIALNTFGDVIDALAQDELNRPQGTYLSEPEFADLLMTLGFVDKTPYRS